MPVSFPAVWRTIAAFATAAALALLTTSAAIAMLTGVIGAKERTIDRYARAAMVVEQLHSAGSDKMSACHEFLETADPRAWERRQAARDLFLGALARLRGPATGDERAILDRIERAERAHEAEFQHVAAMRVAGAPERVVRAAVGERLRPRWAEVVQAIAALWTHEEGVIADTRKQSKRAGVRATRLIGGTSAIAMALVLGLAFGVYRGLVREEKAALRLRESEERLRRGEAAQRLLAGVGKKLSESLDPATTIGTVVRLAVPDLADLAMLLIVDARGALEHVDVFGRDAARVELLRRSPPDPAVHRPGAARVMATGVPELHPVVPEADLDAQTDDPELRARLAALRPESAMSVPLVARARTIGALSLFSTSPNRRYDAADLKVACELAGRAAVAVENARLYQEAREAAALLEGLLSALPDPVCIVDRDGRYRYLSAGCAAVHGIRRADAIGKRWRDLGLPPELADELEARRRVVIETGEIARAEVRLPTARGELDIEYLMAPIRGAVGQIEGVVVAGRDVTIRRRTEEERARLARELADEAEAHERFLAIASHDVKTPLAALRLNVQGLLRAVRRGADAPAWVGEKVARIDQQLTRSIRLLEDVVDVARMREGRLSLHVEEVDLAAVAGGIASQFAEQASASGSALTVRAESPIVGLWDQLRLEQVASNLVSNAIKYGAGAPIEVVCLAHDDTAVLEVRDHGPGIPPERRGELFQRYARSDGTARPGSFGLGLWIVHEVVRALRGRIEVDTTPGGGSTFRVELPRRPSAAAAA